MFRSYFLGPLLLAGFLAGCVHKPAAVEPEPAAPISIELHFVHRVGADSLRFDTLAYQNAAGNQYRVTHLEYYVSDFKFYGDGDNLLYSADSVFYIDAEKPATWAHTLEGAPAEHYHYLTFVFGLTPSKNVSGSLPSLLVDNVDVNLNMLWPDSMGGGYHFLRLEGNFRDSGGAQTKPFLVHVGSRTGQSNDFTADLDPTPIHRTVPAGAELHLEVGLDLNGWFAAPHAYDFNTYLGTSIMDDSTAQAHLRENGEVGVFSLLEALVEGSTDTTAHTH